MNTPTGGVKETAHILRKESIKKFFRDQRRRSAEEAMKRLEALAAIEWPPCRPPAA